MINLGNYEEYFILYMDNELNAEERLMVDNFIVAHPHLAIELDILMSTKLPDENIRFKGKEALLASAMKINVADESLLLYIDNELDEKQKARVEERLKTDSGFGLQHAGLVQAKLDAAEVIAYPDKSELYRHTRKVVYFKTWMRIAAAVILILAGTLFFLLNNDERTVDTRTVATEPVKTDMPKQNIILPNEEKSTVPENNDQLAVTKPTGNKKTPVQQKPVVISKEAPQPEMPQEDFYDDIALERNNVKFDARQFMIKENAAGIDGINSIPTTSPVTSLLQARTTSDPSDEFLLEGENNKTPARGFLRKMSRFIERRTGIGTVNADNELLIGAVALKLK